MYDSGQRAEEGPPGSAAFDNTVAKCAIPSSRVQAEDLGVAVRDMLRHRVQQERKKDAVFERVGLTRSRADAMRDRVTAAQVGSPASRAMPWTDTYGGWPLPATTMRSSSSTTR